MAHPNSKLAVVSALLCNTLVAAIKFAAFMFTGSGAMLSEAIHSVADTMNQGLLLGSVAVWLIIRNRNLLMGPSIPPRIRRQVRRIIDTETYRITAELRFGGAASADKLRPKLAERYDNIADFDGFHRFAVPYADEVIELPSDEIDAIEMRVRSRGPKARGLDLEAD